MDNSPSEGCRFYWVSLTNPTYSCWSGYKEYPQFNFDNPEVKHYFNEVATYWVEKYKIDGWRVDCSSEIPGDFLQEFMENSRLINPEIICVGENWHDNTNLLEHGADGITNYGFYWDVLVPFFKKQRSLIQFAQQCLDLFYNQSLQQQKFNWNFLSNHDLPRFYSLIEERPFLYRNAWCLLFCIPGIPVIYYGEEIEMNGGQDPENRKFMDWAKVGEGNSLSLLKHLITIRKDYEDIFSFGDFNVAHLDQRREIIIISRGLKTHRLLFVLNFSSVPNHLIINNISATSTFTNIENGDEVRDYLSIKPNDFQILREDFH